MLFANVRLRNVKVDIGPNVYRPTCKCMFHSEDVFGTYIRSKSVSVIVEGAVAKVCNVPKIRTHNLILDLTTHPHPLI